MNYVALNPHYTLCEYMDRMQLLNDPIEQSRLLNDLPQVIAELEPDAQDLAKDGPNSSDESLSWDWVSSPQTPKTDMGSGIFSCQTGTHVQSFLSF